MIVPYLDLARYNTDIGDEIKNAISNVIDSGTYILGDEVSNFEKEYSNYCQAKYTIGVGNGMDAIILMLKAAGIGPGNEVLVPSNTYIATWLAVTYTGARPIPVEPDPLTYNINYKNLKKNITERSKAILVVDLYGQPADIDPILEIANENDLVVLDDAAQSHGGSYRGRRIGGHVLASAFSFYPTKNLGALGDGGAVATNNTDIYEKIKELRNYGSRQKYISNVKGQNSRLDEIQAAVLRVKLKYLDIWNRRREKLANLYSESFSEIVDLQTPVSLEWVKPSWHLYVLSLRNRDELAKFMANNGIGTNIHYPVPPHLQNAYRKDIISNYPIAEKMAREVISLPLYPYLSDEEHMYVISKIFEFFNYKGK